MGDDRMPKAVRQTGTSRYRKNTSAFELPQLEARFVLDARTVPDRHRWGEPVLVRCAVNRDAVLRRRECTPP